jgi:hypothetical protein
MLGGAIEETVRQVSLSSGHQTVGKQNPFFVGPLEFSNSPPYAATPRYQKY